VTDRQTDGRTDGRTGDSIQHAIAYMLSRAKNYSLNKVSNNTVLATGLCNMVNLYKGFNPNRNNCQTCRLINLSIIYVCSKIHTTFLDHDSLLNKKQQQQTEILK